MAKRDWEFLRDALLSVVALMLAYAAGMELWYRLSRWAGR